jgi:hypothetical protein
MLVKPDPDLSHFFGRLIPLYGMYKVQGALKLNKYQLFPLDLLNLRNIDNFASRLI